MGIAMLVWALGLEQGDADVNRVIFHQEGKVHGNDRGHFAHDVIHN